MRFLLEKKAPDLAEQSVEDESGTFELLELLQLREMEAKWQPFPRRIFLVITIHKQPKIG